MKYIITWILITTFQANHSPYYISQMKTVSDHEAVSFHNKEAAIRLYEMKKREYEAQFTDSTHKVIPCPKCWSYIDSVRIDSISEHNIFN